MNYSAPKKTGKLLFILVMMATVGLMMNCLYTPAMVDISDALHIRAAVVQMTMVVYMMSFAFVQLVYGPLSDRYGRRPIVWCGLLISFLATLLCYFATEGWMLLLGRALQGVGMAAGTVMYRAIMRDVYTDATLFSRKASAIMVAFSIMIIVCFFVGGVIDQYGTWRSNFLVMLLYLVFYSVVVFSFLKETHNEKKSMPFCWRDIFSRYGDIIRHPVFRLAALFAGLSFGSFTFYFVESTFYLQHVLGLTPMAYGLTASIVAVFLAVGSLANARLVSQWKPRRTLLTASAISVVGALVMLICVMRGGSSVALIVGSASVFMFGIGMGFENATALAMAPFAHQAGMAGAVYGFVQLLGAAVASLLVAMLSNERALVMAVILSLMSLLMVKLALRLGRQDGS
jgi:Bcr/CflA subfamily drug resistance transporter